MFESTCKRVNQWSRSISIQEKKTRQSGIIKHQVLELNFNATNTPSLDYHQSLSVGIIIYQALLAWIIMHQRVLT